MRRRTHLLLGFALLSTHACSASPPATDFATGGSLPPRDPPPVPALDPASLSQPIDKSAAGTSRSPGAAAAKEGIDAPAAPDTRPRLGAVDQFAYIWKRPAREGLALGYVRFGTSVPLLSDKPVAGAGCERGWYAVAPRGYVCLDRRTTLDLEDPYYKALESVAPRTGEIWPYTYAFSNGAPMYSRVPTPDEQEKHEKKFGPRGSFVQLAEWSAGHEELLIKDPIVARDPVPAIFAGGKRLVGGATRSPQVLVWRVIPNGSMVAYSRAFEAEGRVWLLTPDLMLVPADRVRALRRSTFKGVMLGDGVELPLAWNRTKGPKPRWSRNAEGEMVTTGEAIPAKSPLAVKPDRVVVGKRAFYEIRAEPGVFIAEDEVTLSTARTTLPNGVLPGEKWLEAKILPGTLTAYEGLRPVRATLFSPGKGGVPVPGNDHTKFATTQLGYFPLEWKDRVATMSNEKTEPKILWFTDVPHIQYLKAPLAMHVAYWHEDFGNPKSAECVNVAPEDGRWLFGWTDPVLPEGWGGMRPGDGNGRSTPVVVTAR
jgi:hypothetical protein